MKRYVYYDSGTTNSRLYLIEDGALAAKKTRQIGTLDNVKSGDSDTLLRGLSRMYQELLAERGLTDGEIDGIFMSGMATSVNGIFPVDYLPVPVDAASYRRRITWRKTPCFDREIGYLTGLCDGPGEPGSLENVEAFHNVRGEEIEALGMIARFPAHFVDKSVAVVMPGSHTHVLYVENGVITGITSCMGGEFFAAMAEHTILGASVDARPERILPEAVKAGHRMGKKYGVNRALYMTRSLELFTKEPKEVRNSFLEGVVNGGVITALLQRQKERPLDGVLVAGKKLYYEIFSAVLEAEGSPLPCGMLEESEEISFALAGFLAMIKEDTTDEN